MKRINCWLASAALAFVSVVSSAAQAPVEQASAYPQRVLFVGNSFSFYNRGIHNHYSSLLKSAGKWQPGTSRVRLKAISGGKLAEHIDGLPPLFNNTPQRQWDLVVLQDYSNGPISKKHRQAFVKASQYIADYAAQHGSQTALFMTWQYKGDNEMGEALNRAYTAQGKKLGAPVVPVGVAFAYMAKHHPEIELYVADVDGFEENGQVRYRNTLKHPSIAGTYLAACVFYSTLTGESPEGLPYSAGLGAEQASTLQNTAWQAYLQYHGHLK